MPIYRVVSTIEEGGAERKETRMVDAKNRVQAVQHVAKETIVADVIDAREAVRLSGLGIAIEQAANGTGA